jgi:hypothetical protein
MGAQASSFFFQTAARACRTGKAGISLEVKNRLPGMDFNVFPKEVSHPQGM